MTWTPDLPELPPPAPTAITNVGRRRGTAQHRTGGKKRKASGGPGVRLNLARKGTR